MKKNQSQSKQTPTGGYIQDKTKQTNTNRRLHTGQDEANKHQQEATYRSRQSKQTPTGGYIQDKTKQTNTNRRLHTGQDKANKHQQEATYRTITTYNCDGPGLLQHVHLPH